MIYLSKNIEKVFLIDFFTPDERLSNKLSEKLTPVLENLNLEVQRFDVASEEDVKNALRQINGQDLNRGTIIHLIGHGVINQEGRSVGFGNSLFQLNWEFLREPLCQINNLCRDGLIMNTTMMCNGNGIINIIPGNGKPFYAVFASTMEISSKCFENNKLIYQNCSRKDMANHYIKLVISNLRDNYQGRSLYELVTTP